MTDTQAVPPPGTPSGADAGTKPVVATISLLGVLLTGLCLATVDRLDRSTPARSLAVVAVVTALVAVLVALGGQLSALLAAPALTTPGRRSGRRGAVVVLVAGLLSMLAVLLAGAAALFVVQDRQTAVSTEPMVVVQRSDAVNRGEAENGLTAVTAQLTFPGMKAGTVLDAMMSGVDGDANRYVLARSAVRVGVDGPAVVQLAASVDVSTEVVIEATAPGHSCTAKLPPAGSDDGPAVPLSCTTR